MLCYTLGIIQVGRGFNVQYGVTLALHLSKKEMVYQWSYTWNEHFKNLNKSNCGIDKFSLWQTLNPTNSNGSTINIQVML